MLEMYAKLHYESETSKVEIAMLFFNILPSFFFLSNTLFHWYTKELYILANGEYLIFRIIDIYGLHVILYHLILFLYAFIFYESEKNKKQLFLNIWK